MEIKKVKVETYMEHAICEDCGGEYNIWNTI
jgi:hypothetical protein